MRNDDFFSGEYEITNINDVMEIINSGLDNTVNSFPPVPEALKCISTGKHPADKTQSKNVRVRYKFPYGIWFRGQSRSCYLLKPALFRESPGDICTCEDKDKRKGCIDQSRSFSYYTETSMLKHFVLTNETEKINTYSTLDSLCLMQHHGIPTRLLDWSESILIALYFAVVEKNDCDGVLYALNASRLNSLTRIGSNKKSLCTPDSVDVILRSELANAHTLKTLISSLRKKKILDYVCENLYDSKLINLLCKCKAYGRVKCLPAELENFKNKLSEPIAFFPSRKNKRMANQLSVFTLSGGKVYDPIIKDNFIEGVFDDPVSLLALNESVKEQEGKKFLTAFKIPGEFKLLLREQLKRLGIHDASMFPELEYQANYIKKQWKIMTGKKNV